MDQRGGVPLGRQKPQQVGTPTGKVSCHVPGCGFVTPREDRQTAEARGEWHVFRVHPDVWRYLVTLGGDEEPRMAQPKGPIR